MHFVQAKSILSAKNGMNLYRGCSHGCIYCDTRSTCYSFDHPFEDIEVKQNAPELLTSALRSKRRLCMIGTGSMCDPYLPLEEELRLTRRCLEIIEREGFGVTVLTKSDRILQDLELLTAINRKARTVVQMTLTTYDENLCRLLEPNVCSTSRRIDVLRKMREAGIPTVVWLCPILPFLNDTQENLDGILRSCIETGVRGIICFGMGVTLREGNREYFYQALDRHFPGLKQQYIAQYGNAYQLTSPNHPALMKHFHEVCQSHGILHTPEACFSFLNEFPDHLQQQQLSFFG